MPVATILFLTPVIIAWIFPTRRRDYRSGVTDQGTATPSPVQQFTTTIVLFVVFLCAAARTRLPLVNRTYRNTNCHIFMSGDYYICPTYLEARRSPCACLIGATHTKQTPRFVCQSEYIASCVLRFEHDLHSSTRVLLAENGDICFCCRAMYQVNAQLTP